MDLKKINFIILILLPFLGIAQNRSVIVIIDTVSQMEIDTSFNIEYSYGSLYGEILTNKSINKRIKRISDNCFSFNAQIPINSDSSIIIIPFDDNAGRIKISNLSSLKNYDTLRINKVDVFKSDIVDTTYTVIKYFKSYNDSVSEKAYRIKKSKEIDKKKSKGKKNPSEVTYVINGERFTARVEKIKITTEIQTFDGQKPINSQHPKTVFYGRSEKIEWINEISINLNPY